MTSARTRFVAALALLLITGSVFAQTETGSLVCKPVTQRTSEQGCFIRTNRELGILPDVPLYWHIDRFASRKSADAMRGDDGTVIEAYGSVWLMTIARAGWQPANGTRTAEVGPLPLNAALRYTAVYMETSFPAGPIAGPHTHSGPEAFYVLSGEQCLETPQGKMTTRAGTSGIVPGGVPMALTAIGTEQRRSLVLILHDSSHRATTPLNTWKAEGLCAS